MPAQICIILTDTLSGTRDFAGFKEYIMERLSTTVILIVRLSAGNVNLKSSLPFTLGLH